MVRQLPAWHENIKKRQVKAPKIYIRDSGILHTLLGLEDGDALRFHPKIGPSWEGFAIEMIIRKYGCDEGQCYFWSAYGRAELDLMLLSGSRRIGFEIKHTDRPGATRSLQIAREDLKIDEAFVVYPGKARFPLGQGIEAVGLETLIDKGHEKI
jgi:predicted AAA+ superfamily ATPase